MKFAILSDIHGNIQALEASLKVLESIEFDAIIWCGDYITDMPNGHEVISLIREYEKKYKTYAVRGNRDCYILEYVAGKHSDWSEKNRYSNAVRTYKSLTEEDINWLRNLPEALEIECENKKIYVSHDLNDNVKCEYKIYGHYHKQFDYVKDNITYINSGSVGITLDGPNIGAQFTVLEITKESQKIEHYHIQYELEKTIQALKQVDNFNKNLNWETMCIEILKTGKDYTLECIQMYNKLRNEKNINEESVELWEEALSLVFKEDNKI